MVIAYSKGELLLKVGVLEEISTYEHVKYKNSSICRDFGPVEDVCKGPLCCLSCRN